MRAGGDCRGSSYHRRLRKLWLLRTFGSGKTCPCNWCRKRLTYKTLTADRIVPGHLGGTYKHSNIVPACIKCNRARFHQKTRCVARRRRGDYTTKEFAALMLQEWR